MPPTCPTCQDRGTHSHNGEPETCSDCYGDPRELCDCGCGRHHTRCDAPAVFYIDGWRFKGDDLTAYHQATGVLAGTDVDGAIFTTNRRIVPSESVVAELAKRRAALATK